VTLRDSTVVAAAAAVVIGALVARPVPQALALAVVVLSVVVRRAALLLIGLALLASGLAVAARAPLDAAPPPRVDGWATLVVDPELTAGGVRVDLQIDGRRYEAWARGGVGGALVGRLAGEQVRVSGPTRALVDRPPWTTARHIGAAVELDAVHGYRPGAPPLRAANAVRRSLVEGSRSLPSPTRVLFTGFVIGDDRGQDPAIAEAFRAAGLTHLLAVSGQNVAFVLTLAGPLLRRGGVGWRLVAALVVLGLFGLVTRFEPSVLRAVAMAALAVVASTFGQRATAVRLLALAVVVLVLVDPLLVLSTGFRLSVGASAGIVLLAPGLAARLPGPGWLTEPLAVTLAAQVGVAPVLIPTFGGMPVAALPANLLAGPAAGPITAWGLTAGLVAGGLPDQLAAGLHLPTRVLVGYVAWVARFAARLGWGEVGGGSGAAVGSGVLVAWLAHRAGWERLAHLAAIAAVGVLVLVALG
jgi:competence protein ComEC